MSKLTTLWTAFNMVTQQAPVAGSLLSCSMSKTSADAADVFGFLLMIRMMLMIDVFYLMDTTTTMTI